MTLIEAEQEVAKHLEPGERHLWSGVPRQGMMLRGSDAMMIPFSILWCGFIVFWETAAIKDSAPLFFVLWGMPFIAVGLYMLFGRFVVDSKSRAGTAYTVTDRRVLIVSGILSRSVKSLPLRTLSELTLDEKNDGTGTITFGPANPLLMFGGSAGWPGSQRYQPPAFELITRAKEVHQRIREAQRALDPKAS